jgi:hypothetical protein
MSKEEIRDEGLGGKLIRALKNSTGSGKRAIEVEHEGTTAAADVNGSGPYGSSVDRLTVVGPDRAAHGRERTEEQASTAIERQARAIVDRVTYLPEHLREHEVDGGLGRGVLRSRPEEMRDREYHEVELGNGRQAEVSRYRYDPAETRRDRIPQQYSHEALERLTDDLGAVLGEEEGEG